METSQLKILPPRVTENRAQPVENLEQAEEIQAEENAYEWIMTGILKKYSEVENVTLTYCSSKYSLTEYLLHFHIEGHDMCVVKAKPSFWDKGIYLRPELLKDGALRLIPHFVRKKSREDAAKKRSASAMDDGLVCPQKRSKVMGNSGVPHGTTIIDLTG